MKWDIRTAEGDRLADDAGANVGDHHQTRVVGLHEEGAALNVGAVQLCLDAVVTCECR